MYSIQLKQTRRRKREHFLHVHILLLLSSAFCKMFSCFICQLVFFFLQHKRACYLLTISSDDGDRCIDDFNNEPANVTLLLGLEQQQQQIQQRQHSVSNLSNSNTTTPKKKKIIVVTAGSHPAETPCLWLCQGIIQI